MGKKLSGRTLAATLIPNRLHKTKFDPDCNLNVRYPFNDDDQVKLSFQEVVDMLERAREVGKLEATANIGKPQNEALEQPLNSAFLHPATARLVNITRRLIKKAS
jgi:hypothetical protein